MNDMIDKRGMINRKFERMTGIYNARQENEYHSPLDYFKPHPMTKIPCSTCLTESVCTEDGVCRLSNEMKQFQDWLTDNVHISKSNSEIIKNHVSHYFTSPKNDAIQSLQAENEKLKGLIGKAFYIGRKYIEYDYEKMWQQFKTDNGLEG